MLAGSYRVRNVISEGEVPSYRPVTIQVYRGMSENDCINLLKNVMTLKQLRHRFVHYVYGVSTEECPAIKHGAELMVLHERTHHLITLKRLLTWTRENNPDSFTLHCAVTFALQLCEGLDYLEKKGIIHGNLSSHTIRLDRLCNIKLGGIERFPISVTQIPVRWMSLETLNGGQIEPRSIVWTFGVLLWEIISLGARPYHNLKTGLILYGLNQGYRLPRPAAANATIYELMLSCWRTEPGDRPTFVTLHEALTQHRRTLPASKSPSELVPDCEDFWNVTHEQA